MGNKGSKTQPTNPPILNILLLGTSRTGKSLLFYEINKMISKDYKKKNKIDQQKALLSNLDSFRRCFRWDEKEEVWTHLIQFILKLIPNETIDTFFGCDEKSAGWPCSEIWKGILNNDYLRNAVDKKYREGLLPDNFYKLMDKLQKGTNYEEDHYQYCYFETCGIVESMGHFNNVRLKTFDVGGIRSQRKRWIHIFDNQDILFLTISLVEFDQNIFEDGTTNRLTESRLLCSEIAKFRQLIGKKKILLFTKADLLPLKLRNGATYSGKMDYNILPELVNVSIDCNMISIVNSIVSQTIEQIGRENFDSYHLISCLSNEDVNNVLLSAVYNERRNTVSKCLCYSNNFSNKMLQYCTNGKCTDIKIICLIDLSDQNPITKTELPFKHYGIAEKHFLYIALDEIQEISGESEKDGAYYLLSAILDIWDNPYYNVFVLSAGLSTNHSFPESKAIEYNYPPTPLLEMKHLNKILKEKYAKQLFHNSKKSNRKNMLNTEISERLKIAFFKCGGNARYVNEIVRIFEPLINGTRTLKLQEVALQSEEAIKKFCKLRFGDFDSLSNIQKGILIWFTVIPISLHHKTQLQIPGIINETYQPFIPTLEYLQKAGIIAPFISNQNTYYYIPYFLRDLLYGNAENAFIRLLSNNDGSQICDPYYLWVVPPKYRSNNLLEMITINSVWCLYKFYKQIEGKVTLNKLFPQIPFFGTFSSEELIVEWDGMLLNSQFDYTTKSTTIEPNYIYKNGDCEQRGDIFFVAKTNFGKLIKIAIECREARKENQVTFSTHIINKGINILFGRSHLDLKQKTSRQAIEDSYLFTCDDIIKDEMKWKNKSSFDIFIVLDPYQSSIPKAKFKKYNLLEHWQQTNQLILFDGSETIHDNILKSLKLFPLRNSIN